MNRCAKSQLGFFSAIRLRAWRSKRYWWSSGTARDALERLVFCIILLNFVGFPTGAQQFAVGRSKTSTLQYIHAFCDAGTWEEDTLHAVGCHLATTGNVDDKYHFKNDSANTINKILTKVCGRYRSVFKATQVAVHAPQRVYRTVVSVLPKLFLAEAGPLML